MGWERMKSDAMLIHQLVQPYSWSLPYMLLSFKSLPLFFLSSFRVFKISLFSLVLLLFPVLKLAFLVWYTYIASTEYWKYGFTLWQENPVQNLASHSPNSQVKSIFLPKLPWISLVCGVYFWFPVQLLWNCQKEAVADRIAVVWLVTVCGW